MIMLVQIPRIITCLRFISIRVIISPEVLTKKFCHN
jgi:hypothetical protein